jgi:uncharacterized protein
MKSSKLILAVCLTFFSLFLSLNASAINFPSKPANSDFYVDEANTISPADRATINQIISKLWQEHHVAMMVVTIPSLAAEQATDTTVDGYGRALFDFWGLGSQKDNNGILLLVSLGDRHARIELGQSWGTKYNSQADEIMQNVMIPEFKQKQFSTGIVKGVQSLADLASGIYVTPPANANASTNPNAAPMTTLQKLMTVVVGCLLAGLVISLFMSGRTGWGWALIAFIGLAIWWILRNIRMGSGGGGSSGSW